MSFEIKEGNDKEMIKELNSLPNCHHYDHKAPTAGSRSALGPTGTARLLLRK